MKSLLVLTVLLTLFFGVNTQIHYVPAQILIPTFNISAFQGLHNNSIVNRTNNGWSYNGTGLLNETTADGNLIVGTIGNYDRLLFNQIYIKTSRWWSGRKKVIEYPQDVPGGYVRHETISAVRVYNQFYGGNHSKAYISAGGPGYKYMKIILEAPVSSGFKYLVQIFGH